MKQRLQQIAKAGFYSALTISILVVTILLVTIGRGYFFDFKTGQLSGGGLILVDSKPGGASVLLDGEVIDRSTSARLSLRADDYHLRLEKAGYREWEKRLTVVTSEVTWAQYPVLLPNEIVTETLQDLVPPLVAEQSPDQNYLAIAGTAAPQLQVLVSGESELRAVYSLSPEQQTAGFRVESIQWSKDSEHMLIGLRSPAQLSYIVVSVVNSQEVFDITKDFSLPLDNMQFSAQNWREIYWLSAEGLRKLDLSNRTVSAVLANDVTSFRVSDEAVFFVQNTTGNSQLVRLERDNKVKVLVPELPPAAYQLEYSGYGKNHFVALRNYESRQVWLYYNPVETGQSLRKFEHVNAERILLSPDGRFLIMQGGSNFTTLDSEFDKTYKFEMLFSSLGTVSWFDNYHLLARGDGQASIFEFDGGNIEPIAATAESYPAFSSKDQKLLYSIGPGSGAALTLQISHLTK